MTEWQPIETAPKDGTLILLANIGGTWAGRYMERYQSGFVPKNPWQSQMLNHRHMKRCASSTPTHWMPFPNPPEEYTND